MNARTSFSASSMHAASLGILSRNWSATERHCFFAASGLSCTNTVPMAADIMRRCVLLAKASALRMKCTSALQHRLEHLGDCGLDALVAVADDQLHPA